MEAIAGEDIKENSFVVIGSDGKCYKAVRGIINDAVLKKYTYDPNTASLVLPKNTLPMLIDPSIAATASPDPSDEPHIVESL